MCCLIFFAEFLTQQYLKYNMDIRIFYFQDIQTINVINVGKLLLLFGQTRL